LQLFGGSTVTVQDLEAEPPAIEFMHNCQVRFFEY